MDIKFKEQKKRCNERIFLRMEGNIVPVKNTSRFFVSDLGYVFIIKKSKERIIPLKIIKGIPKVKIENKNANLVRLLIEHFIGDVGHEYKYSYKIVSGRIPVSSINLNRYKGETTEELLIFKYKCKEKANAQNSRCGHSQKITDIDVLNCLKRSNYKCNYCGDGIKSSWHLDHVQPISKGGLNAPSNLAASCKVCNEMKNSLVVAKFFYQCEKILKHQSSLKPNTQ